MAEVPTPQQIYQANEEMLISNDKAWNDALVHQSALEDELRVARQATDKAQRVATSHRARLLNQIHKAGRKGSDPGEYLQAVLNLDHPGRQTGDKAIEQLMPLRDEIRSKATPVAIVGSTLGEVCLGFSAGDVVLSRRERDEEDFDTAAGVRLALPMVRTHGYDAHHFGYHEGLWTYEGNADKPVLVGIKQSLHNLRLAGDATTIRDMSGELPPSSHPVTGELLHGLRTKMQTGILPVVAYGEAAVTGLLARFYEYSKEAKSLDVPAPETIVAATVSLDFDPSELGQIDEDEIKERLNQQFLGGIRQGVFNAIANAVHKRQFPNTFNDNYWPVTASPQVMRYASVDPQDVLKAMQQGIEQCVMQYIRSNDENDRPSWAVPGLAEYRVLESEAQELALNMAASRYGLAVSPSQLSCESISSLLAQRLERKRLEREIVEDIEDRIAQRGVSS